MGIHDNLLIQAPLIYHLFLPMVSQHGMVVLKSLRGWDIKKHDFGINTKFGIKPSMLSCNFLIICVLKQTSPSSQLHPLPPGDPSITGEKKDFSVRSRHQYFGAVPLVLWENKQRIFLQPDQQKFPERRTGFQRVHPCLGEKKGWQSIFT